MDTNEVIATTVDTWLMGDAELNGVHDTIHVGIRLCDWLEAKGAVDKKSGRQIRVPLTIAVNNQVDDDVVADTTVIGATRSGAQFSSAFYPWARAAVPIHYDQDELDTNDGTEEMVDLIAARFKSSEMDLKQQIEKTLYGAGAANKSNGLLKIVGTENNTVGGIDSTANSWWDPTNHEITVADAAALTAKRFDYDDVSTAIRKVTFGGAYRPSLLFTRDKMYGGLDSTFEMQERVVSDSEPDMGWAKFMIQGIPITYPDETLSASAGISENDIYMLNSDDGLEFIRSQSQWMRRTEVRFVPNKLEWVVIIHARYNLVSGNRRVNGVLRAKV